MLAWAFQDAGASLVSVRDQRLSPHLLAEWKERLSLQTAVAAASVWLWVVPWDLPVVYALLAPAHR